MISVQINILCDWCDECETTDPVDHYDIGDAYKLARLCGWELKEMRSGRLRTICSKCVKRGRKPTNSWE